MTLFSPNSRRNQEIGQGQIRWFPLFLALLLLLYWLFARYLERVDLRPILQPWWQAWAPFWNLPAVIVLAAEMLHPRVLRHLAVPIIGWLLAYNAAVSLVRVLYDLPDRQSAKRFLSRLQLTRMSPGKPLAVSGQTLAQAREKSEMLRVGGPGLIAIKAGDVAVTEVNGRFHRILGPGRHTLTRLEYIRAILDLRLQERIANDVRLTTDDGIEVRADINVTFRLDTGGEFPTKTKPYPYDEEAVRLTAYNETVLPDGSVSTWGNSPANTAKAFLTPIMAHYKLDELLHARAADEPFRAIHTELIQKMRPILSNQGIELASLHISRLDLPESVTGQYIKYWQTHWETKSQLQLADGKAMSLEEVEIARAEAEMTMIQAIVEGVRRARQASVTDNMQEIIALRLVESLEKLAVKTQEELSLPVSLLPRINSLRQQLEPGVKAASGTAAG